MTKSVGRRLAGRFLAGVLAVVALGCSSGSDGESGSGSRSATGTGDAPTAEAEAEAVAGTGGVLYHDPDTQVAEWVAAHPDDERTPAVRDEIEAPPQARWFTEADPATIAGEVRAYVGPAAEAGEVPVLVVYAIPDRDCGGDSSGGAADLDEWQAWIAGLADGLGDARSMVVLEPDALAEEECLDAGQVDTRHAALATAVTTIRDAAPAAEVYLDAGHSDWNPPAEQARRLREAGVLDAAGFATNVSNFNTTDDEIAYGRDLLDELGDPDLQQVIDVSRNGAGPAPDAEWCDPPGRALGQAPTLDTGVDTVAAYLWIKSPGEADGCAATPGTFLPDIAYALATTDPSS